MDFFARQESARRQSRWLVVTYATAVLCVIGGIDLVALFLLGRASPRTGDAVAAGSVLAWCSILVGGLIFGATWYKVLMLRGGGGVVARDLGGTRVDPATRDPVQRRLVNIVEEMAIASGVPVPEIYILEDEAAINALSAGHGPSDAAVAVTAGMLRRLNREQLEGVIAHEFSHVLNGDMRLSIRLMGLNFGLLVVMLAGRLLLNASSGSSDRKGKGGALVMIAFAIMVLGYLGQVFGRILQAMISRQREHLADASAVQFTRNAEGLKGALLRAAAQGGAKLRSAGAEEVAHMLFLSSGSRLFATHPPTIDRVRELDPSYTEARLNEEVLALQKAWEREGAGEEGPAVDDEPVRRSGPASLGGLLSAAAVAASLSNSVGDPKPEHFARARQLHESLPVALQGLAGSPQRARAFVLALMLATEAATQERQMGLLQREPDGAILGGAVQAELALAQSLSPEQRLPAVLQLFPALRQLTAPEQSRLIASLMALAAADRHIDVFEFSLGKMLSTALAESMRPQAPHGTARLDERLPQIALLFAVLAREGAASDESARPPYAAGMGKLFGDRWPDYASPEAWASDLSKALDNRERSRRPRSC